MWWLLALGVFLALGAAGVWVELRDQRRREERRPRGNRPDNLPSFSIDRRL